MRGANDNSASQREMDKYPEVYKIEKMRKNVPGEIRRIYKKTS
jgi:hypothetical protein